MKIVEPHFKILNIPSYDDALKIVELAGRNCYKSEDKAAGRHQTEQFIRKCIKRKHASLLEHVSVTVRFITSRSVLAELTRHRLCTFHVESTRYVNYAKAAEMEVIRPHWADMNNIKRLQEQFNRQGNETYDCQLDSIHQMRAVFTWLQGIIHAFQMYKAQIEDNGLSPQDARDNLPLGLKTDIICTANLREWRHILSLRSSIGDTGPAHPDIVLLMDPLLCCFRQKLPVFFEDMCGAYGEIKKCKN